MSRADLILYRRMRGIFWGLLVVGIVVLPTILVLALTIPAQLGLYPGDFVRDNGEPTNVFVAGYALAGVVASIAAVILGATAGSVDHQRGVLRDLVVAGRPRWRIVLGRLVAATIWLFGAMLVAFGLILASSLLLAPVDASVDWEEIARQALQFVPSIVNTLAFAAGVALLIGSRGPAIAVYFVLALVVDNVLSVIPQLGDWWRHVSLNQADQQVTAWIGDPNSDLFERPVWHAGLALLAWTVIPLLAGIVRLTRRDL